MGVGLIQDPKVTYTEEAAAQLMEQLTVGVVVAESRTRGFVHGVVFTMRPEQLQLRRDFILVLKAAGDARSFREYDVINQF